MSAWLLVGGILAAWSALAGILAFLSAVRDDGEALLVRGAIAVAGMLMTLGCLLMGGWQP